MTMLRPEKTKSVRLLFSPTELLQIRKSAENASIFRMQPSPIYLRSQAFCGVLGVAGNLQPQGTMVTIIKPPFFPGLDIGALLPGERRSRFFNILEPSPGHGTLQTWQVPQGVLSTGHEFAKDHFRFPKDVKGFGVLPH